MKLILIFSFFTHLSAHAEDFSKATDKLIKFGQETFAHSCVACHGVKGDGQGPAARAITGTKPRNFIEGKYKFGDKPEQVFHTITHGSEGTAMPPWSHLSEKERWALTHFVLSLRVK